MAMRWCGLFWLLIFPTSAEAVSQQFNSLERTHIAGAVGLRLDMQLREYERNGFAGSVLVAKNRRIVLLKGYGMADIEHDVPNTPATRYEMNSITKTFTGAAILKLAADDRLKLDTPLDQLFGPFPPSKRGAMVRQLACHTAGLVNSGTALPGESRDGFVEAMKTATRESAPGTAYRYTNAGYSLLAAAIERVTGGTYEDYVRRHLFRPARLRTAIFANAVPSSRGFAHGYAANPNGTVADEPERYVWGRIGAAGIWSTVGDMYRWFLALQDGKILKGKFQRLAFSPPEPPSAECFGWHVYQRSAHSPARIEKGGGSTEFASQILYYPHGDVLIIWANNNLQKRWRATLNQSLSDLAFQGVTTATLPAIN